MPSGVYARTPEGRLALSLSHMGHVPSLETRTRASKANMGHPYHPKTLVRVSVSDYQAAYYLSHKIERTEICPRCGKEYVETGRTKKCCVECRPEVQRERKERWQLLHPENRKLSRLAHVEKYRITERNWARSHPEKLKAKKARGHFKRRALGFHPLNSWFIGCDGHHINLNDVIYIPEAMHDSVKHNIWTGERMTEINALAGQFLTEDWT